MPVAVALFSVTTVALVVYVVVAVARAAGGRAAMLAGAGVCTWLAFTGLLALRGFFFGFDETPPRLAFAIVPSLLAVAILARTLRVDALPASWLIAPQAFRIAMEAVLWLLWRDGVLPTLLTFHGRNFDIVAGVTAIPVALLASRHPRLARAWNILGLLLLANVTVHGVGSMPTRFRVFVTDPPNVFLAYFPFVWLPAFLIPLALLLHILSLRQPRESTIQLIRRDGVTP